MTFRTLLLTSLCLPALTMPALAQSSDPFANFRPVTDEMIANPDPSDWLNWRRTSNHWGYSPLDQINKENVKSLGLAWSRSMETGFQEATPLVHDGIMYLPHPNDVVQALDATNGDLIWEYRRQLPESGLGLVITRSLAIWEDKVILNTKDNYVVALNAKTGQVDWETQVRSAEQSGSQTTGPIIANGKAISGRNCSQQRGPGGADSCFIAAHDLSNGEEVWRFQTIAQSGSDADASWGDVPVDTRHHIGAWMQPSYDAELNLVYVGTSVTSPYSKFYFDGDIDGDYLYQTSTLALDAKTGELKWHQQHIRDHWDLDHPFERILVDTELAPDPEEVRWINPKVEAGKEYKVLTGIPGKTGIFYSIDRATGEFLWARETVYQNVITDIDTSTGRATMNMEIVPTEVGQEVNWCPAAGGGKDWPAGAYSPETNAIYYPLLNACGKGFTNEEDLQLQGSVLAPDAPSAGSIYAVSVETGKTLWRHDGVAPYSLVTTGGGLVFGGDVNRRFRAFDQETGEVLWETIVNSHAAGFPITYAVDGRQYVAIATGGALISGGWMGLSPEVKTSSGGNSIFVFALPE